MQEKDRQLFIAILKQRGYSLTAGRLLVFQRLWHQPPIDIGSLYRQLESQLDRASLYRTIRLFEQLGIVHRISIGWKYKIELAEAFSHHHHHLTCTECGRIIAVIEDEVIEKQINQLAIKHQIRLVSHQLEIQGICRKCQKHDLLAGG